MSNNEVIRSRQLFIEATFRPKDKVRFGPHDASVARILVSSLGVSYELYWWVDGEQKVGTAMEWELVLLEEGGG